MYFFSKHPSFILEGDRHVHPQTFSYRIQFSTTFSWSIFWYNTYFSQCRVLKWIYYFSVFVHYSIPKGNLWNPSHHSLWRSTYSPIDFFVHNLMFDNFYLKQFWILCVFLAAWSPNVNLLSLFVHYNISKMAIFGSP